MIEHAASQSFKSWLTCYRVLSLPNTSATTLLPLASSVLCASHTIYMVDPISPEQPVQFTGPTNFVQTLVASVSRATSGPPAFLAAMESDRSIHVFDTQSRRIIGSLVMENDVESVTSSMDDGHAQHILAVVNKEGIVEMFPSPFDISNVANQTTTATLKSQRKSTIRKAVGSIRVTLPGSITLPVINASFQDNDLWVAWTKGGIDLGFEKIQWRSEHNGGNIIIGRKDIIKSKVGANVDATVMNGVKDMGKSNVDESRTVVANGRDVTHVRRAKEPFEVIDISSGEEDDSEAENDYAQEQSLPAGASSAGKASTDIVMGDADLEACEEAEDVEEPSFGDLVRANAPEPIDVVAAFTDSGQQILTSSHETDLRLPSGMSLGTVLTQSLRTNDTNLLETCFHVRDHDMVRATIGRLDSSLATTLLRKLAERLHSRPGRAGSLMVWIQSTLVTHGGYLASQPDVVKKLTSLHRVVKERASSLQSLLALKGKLDMLETQLNLRKSMQKRLGNDPATEDDDEDAVIYVEGQEESSSEGEANPTISVVAPRQPKRKGRSGIPDGVEDGDSFDVEGEEDDMPTTMEGVIPDSEDEMSASDAGDLLDDEASETENDSGDGDSEDDVDHYSVDSIDGDEESEPEVPLSKRPTKQKLSNGIPSTKSP